MSMQIERVWARATRLLALAMWGAVGAVSLPALAPNVDASKCSDACDGCQINDCKFCGQVNGVHCYDPKGS